MVSKASIFLLLLIIPCSNAVAGLSFEGELREAVLRNDWNQQVALLQPRKGQNFEQDLQLGKALLQLEKRVESLKVLAPLALQGRDERVVKLVKLAGEMFFSQETSNLYFEAIRFLSVGKYADAKERLEQANSREAGNIPVLTRLVQVEILTGAHEAASARLKEALILNPAGSPELKAFGLKLSLIQDDLNRGESPRNLIHPKRPWPIAEVPMVFTLEALRRWGRVEEIRAIAGLIHREHPRWAFAMSWLRSSGLMPAALDSGLKTQIERELKNRDRFEKELEKQMQQTQHYWVGYIQYEDLVKNAR
jgi:hypothetical protein